IETYLTAYSLFANRSHADSALARPVFETWESELTSLTEWIYRAAMGPVLASIPEAAAAVFVPVDFLAFVPLHLAWRRDQDGARRYLFEDICVTYAPNARSVTSAGRASSGLSRPRALVVANPTSLGAPALAFCCEEVRT